MYTTKESATIFNNFMSKIENGIIASPNKLDTARLIAKSSIIDRWKVFKTNNNLQHEIGNSFPTTAIVKNVKNRKGWGVFDDNTFVFTPPTRASAPTTKTEPVNITIEEARFYINKFFASGFLSGFTDDEMAKVTSVVVWHNKTNHIPFPLHIGKFTITE